MNSSYEGRQSHIPDMDMPAIEVWEFQYPGSDTTLEVSVPEFTCICPKTGLPDFATLSVTYVPEKSCLELKSFKEYILAYRDLGVFHEHVVNRMLADCVKACAPKRIPGQAETILAQPASNWSGGIGENPSGSSLYPRNNP
jgi:7-cyano-7-deazaguanine reductase